MKGSRARESEGKGGGGGCMRLNGKRRSAVDAIVRDVMAR